MARNKATTVDEYLEELPEERRAVVSAVRDVILRNLPKGYQETMNWGKLCSAAGAISQRPEEFRLRLSESLHLQRLAKPQAATLGCALCRGRLRAAPPAPHHPDDRHEQ